MTQRRPLFFVMTHETFQPHEQDFIKFHGRYWAEAIGTRIPDVADAVNQVEARIEHSRWITDCPAPGCGFAMIASKITPFFICWECGSVLNGMNWHRVDFPPDHVEIEAVLLLRPMAINRNWGSRQGVDITFQTLEELEQENRDNGLDVP